MPRPPRQHLPGGFYHVTLRGNHRQLIFGCDADRDALDEIIADAAIPTGTDIHAFCWMSNHLHAVIRAGEAPIGRFVQRVAGRYARYFQRTMRTTGHLFERRYHAVPVAADSQLLATVRYVHLNPVRAGVVDDPARYRWSGHRGYLGGEAPPWLKTAFVLGLFSTDDGRARGAYAQFVAEPISPATGDAQPQSPAARPTPPDRPAMAAGPTASPTLDELVARICAQEQVTENALRGRSREHRLAGIRARIAAEALGCGAASLSDVARRFDRHVASLAKAIDRRRASVRRR